VLLFQYMPNTSSANVGSTVREPFSACRRLAGLIHANMHPEQDSEEQGDPPSLSLGALGVASVTL